MRLLRTCERPGGLRTATIKNSNAFAPNPSVDVATFSYFCINMTSRQIRLCNFMEANNMQFWSTVYRNNAPRLLGTIRRYVSDASTAEDLMHETFITAMSKYDTFRGSGSFEGWLRRIAVNIALMHLRAGRITKTGENLSHDVIDEDDSEYAGERKDTDTILAADFSEDELFAIIERLPEHYKTVFNMYVLDNFTHMEIGRRLDISVGTSKARLSRSRMKIREYLRDEAHKRKKLKKQLFPFALVFRCPSARIDRTVRKRLVDYAVPVDFDVSFMREAMERNATIEQILPRQTFRGSKAFYSAASCGAAATAAIFVILWLVLNPLRAPQSADERENIPMDCDTARRDKAVATTPYSTSVEMKDTSPHTPEPVVVRKRVVERKTVVVRDTVEVETF